ncbi:MAG: DUF58 domain-containing protein [Anaerolineae bacterium]|nr:DUF58 domain-containing protein [Anaerolineae bacterium]
MAEQHRLFDETNLRKLAQLALVANRVRAGAIKGERRSTRRGSSIEFADYRNYTRGDDLRRVDWNIFARLERPFVKLLEEEEDLAVHLLLDSSASMDWPRPTGLDRAQNAPAHMHKFTFARRLLAGLAYIALTGGDRLRVSTLGAPERAGAQGWGPGRGSARTLEMLAAVEAFTTGGTTDLNAALRQYALRGGRPGLCIVISDFFSPTGYEDGLSALQERGHEVALIHVLAPDEVNPPLAGDLRLVDVETAWGQDVTVDAGMRELYQRRLEAWRDSMNRHCAGRGVHYATVETAISWEEVILYQLRKLGVVR